MCDGDEGKGYPEPLSITTAGREAAGSMRKSENEVMMKNVLKAASKVDLRGRSESEGEGEGEGEDHGREERCEERNKEEDENDSEEEQEEVVDDGDADFDPK